MIAPVLICSENGQLGIGVLKEVPFYKGPTTKQPRVPNPFHKKQLGGWVIRTRGEVGVVRVWVGLSRCIRGGAVLYAMEKKM